MKALFTWWRTEGVPWVADNWILVLILPLIVLIWVGKGLVDRTGWFKALEIVDPVARADTRALEESNKRRDELFAEKQRLEAELKALQTKYDRLQHDFEDSLAAKVDELRTDPAKLREWMLRVGRV